jgi:hypothetical protein
MIDRGGRMNPAPARLAPLFLWAPLFIQDPRSFWAPVRSGPFEKSVRGAAMGMLPPDIRFHASDLGS